MLKKGDTIQCADADDAINTMTELSRKGIETDSLYEKDGVQGLWLEVLNVTKTLFLKHLFLIYMKQGR